MPRSVGRYTLLLLPWLVLAASAAGEPAAPVGAGDLARIVQTLAAREYEASRSGTGLQAPNRAHGLRTWFEPTGIRVHDRTAAGSPELLGLSLASVGRGAKLVPLTPGAVASQGARVEIRRPGLLEWYLNSPDGLEQGFTLAERPAGEGPLVLELALRGAEASAQGDGLAFATRSGRRLSYAKLLVTDASSKRVPARLTAPSRGRVRIEAEDSGAVYPLVIDPLLTETADTQLESNQSDARLGASVAAAGDVNGDGYADVIVGAAQYDAGQTDEGAAFVFHGSASGIASGGASSAAAQLESDQANARLGSSVAGAGDVNGDGYADVIVGASLYTAGETNEGAAFMFHGSASGIPDGNPGTAAAQLESDQTAAHLGTSVAGAGDVNGDGYADVIVGADFYNEGEPSEGAAFVFLGSASGIADGNPGTAAAQLESDQAFAHFGWSVAGAGDVNGDGYADVLVGAVFYDAGQGTAEGAAFVFLGSASGIADGDPGTAAAQLESNQAETNFGTSVAGAGDVNGDGYADVIVGAEEYDAGQSNEGSAFVFLGSASGIADGNPGTAAAQLESDLAGARLGASVAGAGDVNGDGYADVIVGANGYDAGQGVGEGAAFVFLGSATGITDGNPTTAAAQLESNEANANFGASVAGAGDVNGDGHADVIVGAYLYGFGFIGGESDEGAAFVYHGGAQGILGGNPATAAAQLDANQEYSSLGISVASAGDVNGDGYADVIVGAAGYDAGQTDEGAAFVFPGSATGIASGGVSSAAAQLESNQVSAFLGASAASAGDVNGDGYADVIVGAHLYNAGQTGEGAAFVFLGSASGVASGNPATAAAQLESDQVNAHLGGSVASAGDVNGDGYADVIVGALDYNAGQTGEGAAFVFLGSATGIASGSPATAAAQLESDQVDARLGSSVASAGDVDGDGYADVIAGAWLYDAGQQDEGAAFVFLGSATGIASGGVSSAAAQLEANQATAGMGLGVASAGDVNGDGYADVIVGTPYYDSGQADEGAAHVFLGGASGVASGNPATAAAQLESNQVNAQLGSSAASAGDVNGDGYADVVVGAPIYDAGQGAVEGAAFVFLGSASGVASGNPATAAAQLESNQASAELGRSVASAGDVNGDGFADLIVGARTYEAGQQAEGAVFLFYGGGNRTGRPVLARQLRGGGGSLPVQPWGASYDPDDFQVRAVATHPQGRGRVKLQVEACPVIPEAVCPTFTNSSWADVTASSGGVTLTQTVSKGNFPEGTLYRWRARVLHAPFGVTQAGITSPPNPAHGPWRRLQGQAGAADIRVLADFDGDLDDDGLLDAYETETNVYVSPTNTGTKPHDPDSDDDGLLDGAEVALGTNPNDSDHDDDSKPDGEDNCPFITNNGQENTDALPAGDACQCGNVDATGGITATDYQLAREAVVKTPGSSFYPDFCDVNGDAACDVEDLAILQRIVNAQPATVANACQAYLSP